MSLETCTGCNRLTNSATSNYIQNEGKEIGVVTECYVCFVDNKAFKGCGYDKLDTVRKKLFEHLLKN